MLVRVWLVGWRCAPALFSCVFSFIFTFAGYVVTLFRHIVVRAWAVVDVLRSDLSTCLISFVRMILLVVPRWLVDSRCWVWTYGVNIFTLLFGRLVVDPTVLARAGLLPCLPGSRADVGAFPLFAPALRALTSHALPPAAPHAPHQLLRYRPCPTPTTTPHTHLPPPPPLPPAVTCRLPTHTHLPPYCPFPAPYPTLLIAHTPPCPHTPTRLPPHLTHTTPTHYYTLPFLHYARGISFPTVCIR